MELHQSGLGRRQFLKVSGVALATVAVAPKLFAGSSAGEQPKRLAVGFASLDRPDAPAVSADSIPFSDGTFIGRGARVTVLGVSNPASSSRRRVGALCAMYSYFDGAEVQQAPFCASAPSRSGSSSVKRVSFDVPVDLDQRLAFSLSAERAVATSGGAVDRFQRSGAGEASQLEASAVPVTFVLRSAPGAISLTRGYYFIAPMYAGDAAPDWSSLTLRQIEGQWKLVDGNGEPAAFEHFVLRIDYGRERAPE